VRDGRRRPRISTAAVVRGGLVLFLARLASLNALEQTRSQPLWRQWLGAALPSADTVGRVFSQLNPDDLRRVLYRLYRAARRKKVLDPRRPERVALILDGHESHASYRRHCSGCRRRRIGSLERERIQYYHSNVTASLRVGPTNLLLDAEPIRPGEGEVGAAQRLVARVLKHLPRAFEVVVVDGLYAQAPFFRMLRQAGKHVIAVLKDPQRNLLQDAEGLFAALEPQHLQRGRTRCAVWDQEGFTSWPEFPDPVRVVCSRETTRVTRQAEKTPEVIESCWYWVTTLPASAVPTEAFLELAHQRWSIENQGFNELANHWHANHVFRHEPDAILAFWLMALLACNLFHIFVRRNLKTPCKSRLSCLHWARLMTSDLYDCHASWPRPP